MANGAINRIAKLYTPQKAVSELWRQSADQVWNGQMIGLRGMGRATAGYFWPGVPGREALRDIRGNVLAEAARSGADLTRRDVSQAVRQRALRNMWLQRGARIGGAWAGLDVATRLAGPGGLTTDDYGRFNIAGVPFI